MKSGKFRTTGAALAMILCVAGMGLSDGNLGRSSAEDTPGAVRVWTTYNDYSVLHDCGYRYPAHRLVRGRKPQP